MKKNKLKTIKENLASGVIFSLLLSNFNLDPINNVWSLYILFFMTNFIVFYPYKKKDPLLFIKENMGVIGFWITTLITEVLFQTLQFYTMIIMIVIIIAVVFYYWEEIWDWRNY